MTETQFHNILPFANDAEIARYYVPVLSMTAAAAILEPLRLAHFLAQVGHECADLHYQEEIADGSAYEGRHDLGNTEPGDGKRFKGRGLLQLTGRANYLAYSQYTRQDFIAHPERISAEPQHAVGVATWFWTIKRLNALADRDDAIAITKVVNGGLKGLDDRLARLARAKRILHSNTN